MAWEDGYRNIVVSGPDQAEIAGYLIEAGQGAFVSTAISGMTAVYGGEISRDDGLKSVAQGISHRFHCTSLLVDINHEWILIYELFQHGKLTDKYCSFPSYGSDRPVEDPTGGDASALRAAFYRGAAAQRVEAILRRNINDLGGEINRHLGPSS